MTSVRLSIWSVVAARLRGLSQTSKVVIMAGADFVLLIAVVLLSYMLRLSSFELPPEERLLTYFIAPPLSVIFLFVAGIYKNVSRNFSTHNETRLMLSQLAVPPLWALVLLSQGTEGFARSVVLIYLLVSTWALVLMRRLAAYLFSERRVSVPQRERVPVLIYGAGKEGEVLVDALKRQGRYRPVAFLDTDYTLIGRTINGLKIKSIEELDRAVAKFAPREVLIAKPDQNRSSRRMLVEMFLDRGLQVKTVPGIDDIVSGVLDANSIRPIRLEDLLGREPVPPVRPLMDKAIKGRAVLVTGAGGSIGSELVRQVIEFEPRVIVLLDNNEFALFEIHRELEARISNESSSSKIVAILANVLDENALDKVMSEHEVEVIFHAAAYKHVRMVQENAAAGIRNNVWGTLKVAEAAMRHNIGLLVLVSTDKAVRPTSIMGASKRVSEMVLQALARETHKDQVFAMVRFGNVLGSTGSVVPLFQEQISNGGPVKVTDPDVTRYFMLIPEAAQLVIQAGAMAVSGEVFVLDMGEPVKILNLAETMIELAGMSVKNQENPEGDIAIEFVGLREGEKLFEELQIGREVSATSHARIMRSNEFYLPWKDIKKNLKSIEEALDKDDVDGGVEQIMHLAQLGSGSS